MNTIAQISHTEYEHETPISTALSMPDIIVSRLFQNVPSIEQLTSERRMPTARLILMSQEDAANQRRGYYHKYIGALAGVGLRSALVHHGGGNASVHAPEDIPAEALTIFSRAVFLAGDKLNIQTLYDETQGASAEHGHVTQFGDWNIDADLKRAIESLPANPDIENMGVTFEKIHDALDTTDVRYKAKIGDNPDYESDYPVITVSRVRPVADLALTSLNGIKHRMEIVKRSTFSVVADHADYEAKKRIHDFLREEVHKGDNATALGKAVIERAISDYRRDELPQDTFPAESLYFAILRKRPKL